MTARPFVRARPRALIAAALVGAVFAAPAAAQERGSLEDETFVITRNISVLDRARPGYEPIGARFGSFFLRPKLEVREEYTDNIYALPLARRDDFLTVLTPGATLDSNWSRHALTLSADGEITRTARTRSEDTEQFQLSAEGRLDISHDLDARLRAEYGHSVQERTSSSTLDVPFEPTELERTAFTGEIRKEFNRVRVNLRFDYAKLNYGNGVQLFDLVTPVIEDDRDRRIYTPNLRIEYALSPDTIFFAQGTYSRRNYNFDTPLDRDSHGVEVVGGIRFDVTALMRGNFALGYAKRFYGPPLVDIGGFSFRGRLEYFPTQLVTVTLEGSRGIEDVASVFAGGLLSTRVSLRADYELLRNLLLNVRAAHRRDDFKSFDRKDRQTIAGGGARYLINHRLEAGIGYNFHKQKSGGLFGTRDFEQSRTYGSLTLKL